MSNDELYSKCRFCDRPIYVREDDNVRYVRYFREADGHEDDDVDEDWDQELDWRDFKQHLREEHPEEWKRVRRLGSLDGTVIRLSRGDSKGTPEP